MRIVFRVDASIQIGLGHLMRCLTLATELSKAGASIEFVSRVYPRKLNALITSRGFRLRELPQSASSVVEESSVDDLYLQWLGCSQQQDAEQTINAIAGQHPEWLVVDHYALNQEWQQQLSPHYNRLMVIDDLANRPHQCDLLLDQNLGRHACYYQQRLPPQATILIGPQYALLRPEFSRLRESSLQRRSVGKIERLLIALGGADRDNVTARILDVLQIISLPERLQITVVLGAASPWVEEVQRQAGEMSWHTDVVVNIDDMAQRMVDADLAIGAAGGTSWERCCLGLPALIVVLAENQRAGADELQQMGCALVVGELDQLEVTLVERFDVLLLNNKLQEMQRACANICDGQGAKRVAAVMME